MATTKALLDAHDESHARAKYVPIWQKLLGLLLLTLLIIAGIICFYYLVEASLPVVPEDHGARL
ncbi:hypothetical protein HY971_03555 [Candidatus Kaiserbacteria bacterium]|nr:hypothetical protein [Candidatus Kaiserbacteria bacterium]